MKANPTNKNTSATSSNPRPSKENTGNPLSMDRVQELMKTHRPRKMTRGATTAFSAAKSFDVNPQDDKPGKGRSKLKRSNSESFWNSW